MIGGMATHKAEYVFKVSDGVPGESDPFVVAEPVSGDLPVLKADGLGVGLLLKKGANNEKAQEVADFLNSHVVGLTTW